jgi:hypothetical protein
MTKEETVKLLMLVKANYINAYKDMDESTFKMMVSSWSSFFEDIPLEVMVKVVQKHILTNVYPPQVKELREQAVRMINPTNSPLSAEMAWENAHKAVTRTFGRYQKDKGMEYLRSQNQTVARAVEAIGWNRICDASNEDLAFRKREFVEYYNQVSAPERESFVIPTAITDRIKQLQLEHAGKPNEPKQLPEV